jgi:hypothetical protein
MSEDATPVSAPSADMSTPRRSYVRRMRFAGVVDIVHREGDEYGRAEFQDDLSWATRSQFNGITVDQFDDIADNDDDPELDGYSESADYAAGSVYFYDKPERDG